MRFVADQSDESLLDEWRRGDEEAGKQLFERHFAPVYRFFCNKVGGDDVDDLVQETFLGCVNAKERFRGDASFRTFLFAVARKQLYKYRDRVAKKGREGDFDDARVAALDASPTQLLALHEEQKLLLRGLRRLPLDMQIALELCYWDGLSSTEIGNVLDIPAPTARSRLRRGKELLREKLERLAAAPTLLQSTVDNFEQWLRSMRGHVGRAAK